FTLNVPLTLTKLRAVLVRSGGETFAFVGTNVHALLALPREEIRTVEGRPVAEFQGRTLSLARLSQILGLPDVPAPADSRIYVVVAAAGDRSGGLIVDALLEERLIVVKRLGMRPRRTRWI